MSDAERLEPTEAEAGEGAISPGADELRAEIDEARAATESYRAKAAELIAELRAREAKSRGDAARAETAAAVMGVSEGAVKVRLLRAVQRLRDLLDREDLP